MKSRGAVASFVMATLAFSVLVPGTSAFAAEPEYKDTTLPFSVRAADLVSRMTLEEKYDQLIAMQPHATWRAKPKAIDRLGVKSYGYWSEANHGIYFPVVSGNNEYTQYPQSTSIGTMWNRDLTQKIGAGIADEARVTYNTSCPPGMENPNPSGGACYGLTYWSPNQNLNRDPRWGRADEAYTEDPLLAGEVASAFVTGMQGDTKSRPDTIPTGSDDYIQAVATPKHYLANNSEANRNFGTSNISERAMHEYFLPPFKASAGDAGARSLMTAYNAISVVEDYTTDYPSAADYPTTWSPRNNETPGGTPGTPAASSRYAIETLLRRSYGFDGFVVSDCDAISRVHGTGTSGHSWQPAQLGGETRINKAQGNAWALKAGTDLDCSGGDYPSNDGLKAAQSQGLATEADIDVALVRAFTARFQMGEFDPVDAVPYNDASYSLSDAGDQSVKIGSAAHRAVAHESALEAPVLLKNESETLPFRASSSGKTVALGHVDSLNQFQSGSYSGPSAVRTTFAQALVERLSPSAPKPATGSRSPYINDNVAVFPDALNADGSAITTSTCAEETCDPEKDKDTAEYQISQADNVLVVVGHRNNDGGEGTDRQTVELPRQQAELIRDSIAPLAEKYGKQIVVWIQAKTMVDLSLFKDLPQVGSIVWSSFNGMYQGKAMAELLFNDIVTLEDGTEAVANFSGKLPLTWYSDVDAQLGKAAAPERGIEDYRMTQAEGSRCGRTYLYYQVGNGCAEPDYVFGHGLSYSPFVYGDPILSSSTITPNDPVTVSVPVTNQVANYPGKAVAEVYVQAPTGADGNVRPLKQLKGFAKSGLITGTPETLEVTIDAGDLWFWDDENDRKEFPTGEWTILAGPSSADSELKSATLTVEGERTGGVEVVSVQPDGTELSLDTPDNRINAQISVTKHDMSFWDLQDRDLKVEYSSSNPAVATVDSKGTVAPVAAGTVLITAKATANGESKSTTFPVVVTSGNPDVTGTVFPNDYTAKVNFGDLRVSLDAAKNGKQLAASLTPAAQGVTYSYQIAPMDTNTAGAQVTPTGVLTAAKDGSVRVTATAQIAGGAKISESALITIATPKAVNDTSTGRPNQTQSVNPLENDEPSDPGVPLDPSTLKLLNADGQEVSSVTVPEGKYTISSGTIVFTPKTNYFGKVTPVKYQVEDSSGAKISAEYQPVIEVEQPSTDTGTSSAAQGVQQSWKPTPTPGQDFAIVSDSLTLLDEEGQAVDRIEIADVGVFTIDAGKIVFTPDESFVGPVEPVTYRITDEGGQHATGTYQPTVTEAVPGEKPGPVTGVQVKYAAPDAVITWKAVEDNGGSDITEYNVYQNGVKVKTVPAGEALKTTVSGLKTGTYKFTVTAVNGVGEGPASSEAVLVVKTEVIRYGGADRYETASKIVAANVKKGAPIFVAAGDKFPDGLSAAPAAVKAGGSLILTRKAVLPPGVLASIKAAEPSEIFVIGGVDAVSDSVINQLKGVKKSVTRVGGADRYQTSEAVFRKFFADKNGKFQGDKVFLATGRDFPDSLTGAATAGALSAPVVLVNGKSATSAPSVIAAAPKATVIIVGGTDAVNKNIEKSVRAGSKSVERLAGADRYATALAVNAYRDSLLPKEKVTQVWIATGRDFPDALSSAAIAGREGQRIVLSKGTCSHASVNAKINGYKNAGYLAKINLAGGKTALADSVGALTATCR